MKIAVCICGLMRVYQQTYQNQLQTLFNANAEHDIDLFIVTEVPKGKGVKSYKAELEYFYRRFKPTVLVNEHKPEVKAGYSGFKEQFVKLNQFLDIIGPFHDYDLLVRTRSDVIYDKPIELKDLQGIQAIGGWWLQSEYPKRIKWNAFTMQDMVFATDFPTMELICELREGHKYRLTEKTNLYNWEKRQGCAAETQLLLLAVYHDIPFYPIDTGYNFVRKHPRGHLILQNPEGFYHYDPTVRPIVYDRSIIEYSSKAYY